MIKTDPLADLRTLRDYYLAQAHQARAFASAPGLAKVPADTPAWEATAAHYDHQAAAVEVTIAARSGAALLT